MKKLAYKLVIFTLIVQLTACTRFGPEQTQAWAHIDNGALILDVRTKQEFDDGHLPHAINIEYENIPQIAKRIGKNKERSVVLYCRSGRRASVALAELKKLGYSNVFNGGGLNAMKAAKKEYEKQKTQ
jgi:phage shock protein E